jgi:hypothetical protein
VNHFFADFVAQLASQDKAIQSPCTVDQAFCAVMILGFFHFFNFPAILP